jgi:tryptophan synthase alpha chain
VLPFVTAGYPSIEATVPLLGALERAGAVAVELGIPFSDPLADGPAIQRTSELALEQGVGVGQTLECCARFREQSEMPIVLMTYLNPLLAYGVDAFSRGARRAGVSGVILTDLPPEERPDVWNSLSQAGLDRILLIAPTTEGPRRGRLARAASGFVYCLTRTGVTGDQRDFSEELGKIVAEVRAATEVPIGVGFGVSTAERARTVAALAEAVIVGAALCERLEEHREAGLESALGEAEKFIRILAEAVAEVRKDPSSRAPAR